MELMVEEVAGGRSGREVEVANVEATMLEKWRRQWGKMTEFAKNIAEFAFATRNVTSRILFSSQSFSLAYLRPKPSFKEPSRIEIVSRVEMGRENCDFLTNKMRASAKVPSDRSERDLAILAAYSMIHVEGSCFGSGILYGPARRTARCAIPCTSRKVVHSGHDAFINNVEEEDDILSENEENEDILLSDGDVDVNDGDVDVSDDDNYIWKYNDMPGSGRARAPITTASQGGSNSSSPPNAQSNTPNSQSNEANGAVGSATNISRVISSEGSSSKKRGRGPTRGLALAKKKQRWEDLHILVSENRIDKFNLPNDEDLREKTEKQMQNQWVNFRSAMHCREFKKYESMEVALQHCPPVLTQDRWRDLCLTFIDSEFQEISKINQQNKAQQTIVHTTGSKGFHCLEFEMTKQVGEKPTMKEFWKISHIRRKKDGDNDDDGLAVDGEDGLRWVSNEAKKVHDDVEALQLQSLSENGVTLNYDEAYARVTGPRAGYIRGRGAGPKPVSSSARAIDKEKDDARDK
ncbi:hypothetical protein LguiA_005326 [Lonicera macranthoides]